MSGAGGSACSGVGELWWAAVAAVGGGGGRRRLASEAALPGRRGPVGLNILIFFVKISLTITICSLGTSGS